MLEVVAALSCGLAPAPYFAPSAPAPSLSCVAFLQWALLSLLSCGTKRRDHGTKVQQNNKQEEIVRHGPRGLARYQISAAGIGDHSRAARSGTKYGL